MTAQGPRRAFPQPNLTRNMWRANALARKLASIQNDNDQQIDSGAKSKSPT
uniref:Uncharacterized protein n=1 Tax=Pseudomonas fluorescens (strain SBW25) TaxID=216595 RepID=A0A0G4E5P9_PSEFS|nr:hypothetical protein PQBR57_0395 [Pseudomonas fluorescens SBW25]